MSRGWSRRRRAWKTFDPSKRGLRLRNFRNAWLALINTRTQNRSFNQFAFVFSYWFFAAPFSGVEEPRSNKERRREQAADFNARLNDWVCVFTHLTYDRSSCGFALATKTLIVITSRHAMSLVSTFVENQWITLNDGKRNAYVVLALQGTLKPLFAATVFHRRHHHGTSIIVRHTFIYER